MKLIKPRPLQFGDTLGVIACSTPITDCSEDTIQRAYSRLREHGFKVIEAPNCRTTHGLFRTSPGVTLRRCSSIRKFP